MLNNVGTEVLTFLRLFYNVFSAEWELLLQLSQSVKICISALVLLLPMWGMYLWTRGIEQDNLKDKASGMLLAIPFLTYVIVFVLSALGREHSRSCVLVAMIGFVGQFVVAPVGIVILNLVSRVKSWRSKE